MSDALFVEAEAGDCFEAAGKYIMDNGVSTWLNPDKKIDKKLILVHGEVGGQGPLEGVRYGHAWVEDGNMVIDKSNGRDIKMPKDVYYALGKVIPDFPPFKPNLHKYTPEEFRKQVLRHEHWGPWDLETSSGL